MSMGLKGTGRSPVFLQVDGEYTDLPPVKAVELTGVIVGSFEGQKDAAQMTLNNGSEKISMYGVDYFVIGSKSWMSGPYTWYAIMKDPITGHWRLYNLEKKNLKICINDEPISAEKDYADLPIGAKITTPSVKESPVLFFKLDEVYAKKMALDKKRKNERDAEVDSVLFFKLDEVYAKNMALDKKRKNERDAEVDSMTARHLEESMAILDGLKKNLMNASDTLYTLNGKLKEVYAKKMALDKKRKNEKDAEVDSMTARHLEESMAILGGLKKNLMNASDTLYTLNGRLETTHDRVKKARASP